MFDDAETRKRQNVSRIIFVMSQKKFKSLGALSGAFLGSKGHVLGISGNGSVWVCFTGPLRVNITNGVE